MSAWHGGLPASVAYIFDTVRVGHSERKECFDERFGTRTGGKVYSWQLRGLHGTGSAVHPYEAAPASQVRKILGSLPISPSAFTFVDMGSGMGRALLIASELSFRRIVGIELSRELHETALSNVRQYGKKVPATSTYDLRCLDASHYEFETVPLVVFFYNPFGKPTFELIISKLERSFRMDPRPIFIVYLNPRFEGHLKRSQVFQRLRNEGSRLRPWRHCVVYCARP